MTANALPAFYSVHRYETIGSSNDAARALAQAGAPEGALVWASEQTAGRGRRGRGWSSPPGNLYLSMVLRPRVTSAAAAQIGFVAAIALGEAVAALLPDGADRIRYKWPNDLLVDGAKLAGILLEAGPLQDLGDGISGPGYIVAGIGANVVSAPTDTAYPATSLVASGAQHATADILLVRFAARFEAGYRIWRDDGFDRVRGSWLLAGHRTGEALSVRTTQDQTIDGQFVDLDADGSLLLRLANGETRRISAGDVAMLAV